MSHYKALYKSTDTLRIMNNVDSEINTPQWMKVDIKVLFHQHKLFHLLMTTRIDGIMLVFVTLLIITLHHLYYVCTCGLLLPTE